MNEAQKKAILHGGGLTVNSDIKAAVNYQKAIKYFTEEVAGKVPDSSIEGDFLAFARSLLPDEKYKIFKNLLAYPLPSVGVADTCLDRLSIIFKGEDPVFNYQFKESKDRDDWEYYRQDVLKMLDFWKSKGWAAFRSAVCSLVVVDAKPTPGVDGRVEPYAYFLDVSQVRGIEFKNDGSINWVVFNGIVDEQEVVLLFTDKERRVFKVDAKNNSALELYNFPHDLGYCPVNFFWGEAVDAKKPMIRKSIFGKVLSELRWFVFMAISKKHLDLYGAYPIYSGYEQDCDFNTGLEYCQDGFLRHSESHNNILNNDGSPRHCPACYNRRHIGLGTFVTVPIPGEGEPDLRNPVQVLPADVNTLDYNVSEVDRLRANIINQVVGLDSEVINKRAVNEKQVTSSLDSKEAVIEKIKAGFERVMKWVDETICLTRYPKTFLSANISLGTVFYKVDAAELREKYKAAKEAGAPEYELDNLQIKVITAETKGDPVQFQRILILRDLEPYPHRSIDEVIKLRALGVVSDDDLKIKANFVSLIARFERENINIIEFGVKLDYDSKIETIRKVLEGYVQGDELTTIAPGEI